MLGAVGVLQGGQQHTEENRDTSGAFPGRHGGTGGSEWVRESEPRGVPGPASLGVLAFFSFEEGFP